MGNRPLGVTILTVLAGISLVLAVVHFLQALGILPYFVGEGDIQGFNLWYAIVWGLLIWVWAWVISTRRAGWSSCSPVASWRSSTS